MSGMWRPPYEAVWKDLCHQVELPFNFKLFFDLPWEGLRSIPKNRDITKKLRQSIHKPADRILKMSHDVY